MWKHQIESIIKTYKPAPPPVVRNPQAIVVTLADQRALDMLKDCARTTTEIASAMKLSKTTTRTRMAKLQKMGMVVEERGGIVDPSVWRRIGQAVT